MRILLLLGVLCGAVLAAIILLNWQTLAADVPLDVGVATMQAPVALIILAGCAAVIALLATFLVAQALSAFRMKKALEKQHLVAEHAESSRFNDLRLTMTSEFERLAAALKISEGVLRIEIHGSANSLAAMIAEMDDRGAWPVRGSRADT